MILTNSLEPEFSTRKQNKIETQNDAGINDFTGKFY